MKEQRFPTISVVIATFNSDKTIDRVLSDVRKQNYLQENIEIILGDGGSTDQTVAIAKKYNAKVVSIPKEKQHSEYNRGVAFNKATGELVLVIDHDNYLPYTDWLQDMVAPLLKHPKMVATETCYYHYDKKYTFMDRYFALFGASDPLPYYFGRADRLPYGAKEWTLLGKSRDMGDYFIVTFDKDPHFIPTIGTNGCLMRRDILMKYANVDPDYHYPIDVMVDVIQKGHNEFGFVKNSIIHLTNERGFLQFLKRRYSFMTRYHFASHNRRRYSVLQEGDELKLIKYVFYSATFVKPTYDAIKGFSKIPDSAWFLHPFLCIGLTVIYGYATIRNKFKFL